MTNISNFKIFYEYRFRAILFWYFLKIYNLHQGVSVLFCINNCIYNFIILSPLMTVNHNTFKMLNVSFVSL